MAQIIADTGILVSYLDVREAHHGWVKDQLNQLSDPLLTCDAVITEAAFLFSRRGCSADKVFELLDREIVSLAFDLGRQWPRVSALCKTYASVPMSVADACLVRMSELEKEGVIFTLDRDFQVYRRNGRQHIPLLAPFL